jgi:hypothetical protein
MSMSERGQLLGPDSATRLLALSGGLVFKTTRFHFLRLATLPVCPRSHHHVGGRSKQSYPRHELTVRVPHSVLTFMKYKGNYWLINSQMVKYQSVLCENPCIWLEVVKTLNLDTILPIDSGPRA